MRSGAELRREWPVEVGHSGSDAIQSDVLKGAWTCATLCLTLSSTHTHTHGRSPPSQSLQPVDY